LKPAGERERPCCPNGHWTHWNNPIPVVAAVIEVDDQILLARNAAWPSGPFVLITGFLEEGETPEQGIAREVKEETNLDAEAVSLLGVYEAARANQLIIGYHVKASGAVSLSEELIEYRLFAPADLRPWHAGTGYALADWMRHQGIEPEFLDVPELRPN
jgi:NADH pyrophosphatase NudC (nudix superfamily)